MNLCKRDCLKHGEQPHWYHTRRKQSQAPLQLAKLPEKCFIGVEDKTLLSILLQTSTFAVTFWENLNHSLRAETIAWRILGREKNIFHLLGCLPKLHTPQLSGNKMLDSRDGWFLIYVCCIVRVFKKPKNASMAKDKYNLFAEKCERKDKGIPGVSIYK